MKTKTPRSTKYNKHTDVEKARLAFFVFRFQMTVKRVATLFGMKYATAKHIISLYKSCMTDFELDCLTPPPLEVGNCENLREDLPSCKELLEIEDSDELRHGRLKRNALLEASISRKLSKLWKLIRRKYPRRNDNLPRILKPPVG
jgi:hypothetical protein